MAVESTEDVGIAAPPAVCFAATADLERWTEWPGTLSGWMSWFRPTTAGPGGSAWWLTLYGKEYDATLEVLHNRAAQELRFCLIEAANLASLEGSFH